MASSLADRVQKGWTVGRLEGARLSFFSLAPALMAAVVFKLAISDGGRHPQSLTLAQILVYAVLGVLVWTGRAWFGSVGRGMTIVLGAIALTSLGSVRPEASVRELLLWAMYLGIVVVTASTLTGLTAARRFLEGLVVIAGWLCLIAAFMFWGANNPGMRWYATFYWPNPFAAFLLLVLPLQIVRLAHARHLREALGHGALTALLAVALVLTYSRGGWLALLLVLPVAGALLRPPSWPAAVVRLLVVVALVAGVVVVLTHSSLVPGTQGVAARAASVADAGDVSIQGRWNFWRAGLAIFRDHPLLGTGAGTFGAAHARYQRDVRFFARDAHSLYIQTLAEMGVAGAIALAALILAMTWLWLRALRHAVGTDAYPLMLGTGLGVLAFLLHSGLDMDWSFPANPAMASALVGIIAWYNLAAARIDRRPVSMSSGVRLAVVVGLAGAILVVIAMQSAYQEYLAGQEEARSGRWHQALRSYTAASIRNPLSARYQAAAAYAAAQFPDRDRLAVFYLNRAIVLDRMNASHTLQMADLLFVRAGDDPARLAEVERWLEATLRLDPLNRPEAYRLLAGVHLRAGRRADAEWIYRRAATIYRQHRVAGGMPYLLLWPEIAGLYQSWASFLAADGRYREAESVLRQIISEDPEWAPAYAQLAMLLRRQGSPASAGSVLREGMERVPTSEMLWTVWQALSARRTFPPRPWLQ